MTVKKNVLRRIAAGAAVSVAVALVSLWWGSWLHRGSLPPTSAVAPKVVPAAPAGKTLEAYSFTKAERERIEEELEESSKRRFDEPDAAAEFEAAKRRPVGKSAVPMDRYLTASQKMDLMPGLSSSSGLRVPSGPLSSQMLLSNWAPLGPGNIGGRTRTIVIDPNNPDVMYLAGVAGGVWKTTNAGASWIPVGDILPNLAVSTMAMDPANSSVLYAGTGEGFNNFDAARGMGIFRTADGGTTWTSLAFTAALPDFHYVNKIVVSRVNTSRIYAATRTGVWRSTDAGLNWTKALDFAANSGCLDLVIRTDQTVDYLFAACGNLQARIYRNMDAAGAGSWTQVYGQTEANMGRTSLALAPSNQGVIYAMAESGESGDFNRGLLAVFRSVSSGDPDSWTARVRNTSAVPLNRLLLTNPVFANYVACSWGSTNQFFNQGRYDNVLAVDPMNSDIVWSGGIDLFRSNDGGQNWGLASYWWGGASAHADQHAIVFHPQYNGTTNQTIYVGNDGGLYRTSNGRANVATGATAACNPANTSVTWANLNNGIGLTQFYHGVPYPGGTTFFGGTQDNGTVRGSIGGGANAWSMILGGDGGYVAVDPGNTNILYAENYALSIKKSTSGGLPNSWVNATAGITGGGFLFITPFTMDPSNSQRLWTGGNAVWRTTNGASSWTQASAPLGNVSAVSVAPSNSEVVAIGTIQGTIHVTQSSSAATAATVWPISQPRYGWVSWIAFDPTNSNTLYATYSSFNGSSTDAHVYRSTNGGGAWTPIDGSGATGIPDIPVHSIAVDPSAPQRLFVGTDLGVFTSTDTGATWNREIAGFAPAITESLTIQSVGSTVSLYAFTHGRGAWRTTIGPAANCSYILSPASQSSPVGGGPMTFTIEAGGGCAWTATSNAAWITVASVASGTGHGTAIFNVAANGGAARQGTITVGSAGVTSTFTVNQAGVSGVGNDEISGATFISALPYSVSQNSSSATSNPTDPVHSCTQARDSLTVWFRYVAGFTGVVAASTAGSGYDTVLTAYPGTSSSGAELACNDDTGSTLQSAITFNVTNGQSYLIEVSGYGPTDAGGPLSLSISTQQPPTLVSVTPGTPTTLTQTFAVTARDPNGASDISKIYFLVNTNTSIPAGSCHGFYERPSNSIFLYNDALTAVTGPLTPGTTGTLQNSQCGINGAASSVTASGTDVVLNLSITRQGSYATGARNLYIWVVDNASTGTGWVQASTWTVATVTPQPPILVSVAPGTSTAVTQTFAVTARDPNGASDINKIYFLVNTNTSIPAGSCHGFYERPSNSIFLYNDALSAVTGPLTPGTTGTVQNSQCAINGAASSVTASGTDVVLNLSITRQGSYATGARNLYIWVTDNASTGTGWVQASTWTVAPVTPQPPTLVSVTPGTSTAVTQTFAVTARDPNGASDISKIYFLVNTNTSIPAGSCHGFYDRGSNSISLYNDALSALIGPISPGGAGTLQNSQCAVNGAASSVTASGTDVVLNLSLTRQGAYAAGTRNLYIWVTDNANTGTGWVQGATWSIASGALAPTLASATPGTTTAATQTFTLTGRDGNGFSDIQRFYFLVNTNPSIPAGSCHGFYERASNSIFLYNDALTAILGPLTPGGTGTLQNSQCAINGGTSSVSAAGTDVVLNLSVTRQGSYSIGLRNLYIWVTDNANTGTGWVQASAWSL